MAKQQGSRGGEDDDKLTKSGEEDELTTLPRGRHGLSPEQIAESQRERLLAAAAEVIAAEGYKSATITAIVNAASVSSRSFYEQFGSKEELFLEAFDAVLGHLRELLAEAAAAEPDWPHQTIAVLREALDFFQAEPALARLCLLESVTATPALATRFREAVLSCVPYLRAGREQRAAARELPDSTEDSLLGGLIFLASRSILTDSGPLPQLLPDLVEFVLSPYLGAEQAKALAAQAS
jgi:AcrR family transcriptional regulator